MSEPHVRRPPAGPTETPCGAEDTRHAAVLRFVAAAAANGTGPVAYRDPRPPGQAAYEKLAALRGEPATRAVQTAWGNFVYQLRQGAGSAEAARTAAAEIIEVLHGHTLRVTGVCHGPAVADIELLVAETVAFWAELVESAAAQMADGPHRATQVHLRQPDGPPTDSRLADLLAPFARVVGGQNRYWALYRLPAVMTRWLVDKDTYPLGVVPNCVDGGPLPERGWASVLDTAAALWEVPRMTALAAPNAAVAVARLLTSSDGRH